MIKKHYALLDHTAQVFLNSLPFKTDAEAIRWFTSQVNGNPQESLIAAYPEQYTLYRVADFDDKTGCYQPRDIDKKKAKGREITEADSKPMEIITGVVVQEEEKYRYSIEDIIKKIEMLIQNKNVSSIQEAK
jgi:hypothetical protein